MKILVCGGRNYDDRNKVFKTLDVTHETLTITAIIHGGAHGADYLASLWSRENKIKEIVFYPDWNAHGKAAGPIRNLEMLMQGQPDVLIAFPGGKGTEHMCSIAKKQGTKVIRII